MAGNALGGWLPALLAPAATHAVYSPTLWVTAAITSLAVLPFASISKQAARDPEANRQPLDLRVLITVQSVQAVVLYSLLMGLVPG
jgi:hypothetical protein